MEQMKEHVTEEVLFVDGDRKSVPLKCGVKHDNEKPMLSLLPASLILEVGKVLTYGANKYEPHNWRKGISQARLISAALRHITAYNEGENVDKESHLHHLAHAICELSFAMDQNLHPDLYYRFDDRYTGENYDD